MTHHIKDIETALSIFNNTPHFVWWKNADLQYIMINQLTAQLYGFQSSKVSYDFVTDEQLPTRACELANDFAKQDQLVMKTKKNIVMFNFCDYGDNDWRMLMGHKFPRLDDNGKVNGVSCTAFDVTDCSVMRTAIMLLSNDESLLGIKSKNCKQFTYMIRSAYTDFNLTQRESECLFLLMRGKTTKEIANLLEVNPGTVEKHLDKVKLKMQCARRSQLVEKALANGAGNIIPKSLLSIGNLDVQLNHLPNQNLD